MAAFPREFFEGESRAGDYRAVYIRAASERDVIYEQLIYLVLHREACDTPGCPDCKRLNRVQKALLSPFKTPKPPASAQAPEPIMAAK